ncbi:MAG: cysteine rich repeat-containing protein [Proteobacteria bacterium]|nr:cysteine rich repeat-containing protein [Pseudomonadota bacterium]
MNSTLIRTLALLAVSGFATSAVAQELSDAQRSAIKSACRGDYMKVCSSVPTGTKASLQCLVQNSSSVSAGCQGALAPAMTGAPAAPTAAMPAAPTAAMPAAPTSLSATTAPAAPPATAAPSAPVAPIAVSPRAEARVLRTDCGGDFQKFCSDVRPGGGRGIACLRDHAKDLSPSCQNALQSLAGGR